MSHCLRHLFVSVFALAAVGCASTFYPVGMDSNVVTGAVAVSPENISSIGHKIAFSEIKNLGDIDEDDISNIAWRNNDELVIEIDKKWGLYRDLEKSAGMQSSYTYLVYQLGNKKWFPLNNRPTSEAQPYVQNMEMEWAEVESEQELAEFKSYLKGWKKQAESEEFSLIDLFIDDDPCPDEHLYHKTRVFTVDGKHSVDIARYTHVRNSEVETKINGRKETYCSSDNTEVCALQKGQYTSIRCPEKGAVLSGNRQALFDGAGIVNLNDHIYFSKEIMSQPGFSFLSLPPRLARYTPSPNFEKLAILYVAQDGIYIDIADLSLGCQTELICD